MCFVCISEQAAIISVFNINWLVFITKREGVYCAVRTESVNILVLICLLRSKAQIDLYVSNQVVNC
jgi:hypothetical protein